MKKRKRLLKRQVPPRLPALPRTEEEKQRDMEATAGVAAFAGSFLGALGGALAASAGTQKPPAPWAPLGEDPEVSSIGDDPSESAIVNAIEDLIDAKIGRDLLLDGSRVDKARDKLESELGQLLRRVGGPR